RCRSPCVICLLRITRAALARRPLAKAKNATSVASYTAAQGWRTPPSSAGCLAAARPPSAIWRDRRWRLAGRRWRSRARRPKPGAARLPMGELNSPPRQERLDPIFVPPGRVGGAASLILDGAIEIAHPLKIARLSTPLEAQQARRGGVRVLEIGV